MPKPATEFAKPGPLLPKNAKQDRPLSIVLCIFAFLATITLLSVYSGLYAADRWQSNLDQKASIQIMPDANTDIKTHVEAALNIVRADTRFTEVSVLPEDEARALLQPWLGDVTLPDDLPLPVLINLTVKPGQNLGRAGLESRLRDAGITANVDDHKQWSTAQKRAVNSAQLISLSVLLLIITASLFCAVYVTRAGIAGHRNIVSVLHQIGAPPAYTARLFSLRYLLTSLRAGAFGAGAALLLFAVTAMAGGAVPGGFMGLPGPGLNQTSLILTALVPLVLAALSSLTAWRTVRSVIMRELYP